MTTGTRVEILDRTSCAAGAGDASGTGGSGADTFETAVERPGLRVAALAAAVGVSPDTVRYYERAGLLHPPERTPTGYRVYGAAAVDRLRFIRGCQRLGLRLREIADLLAVRDTGVCPCEPAEQLLRRRIAEVDVELARLTALRAEMTEMAEKLPTAACPPPVPGRWCPPDGDGR
ncbi:MerR family transcriptional regulator [Micromonospora sp. LOL_014]|uniref:MerR family transcriptional regulator n=1 Tax=Micromonospora sp. LOL_014 TaxID=3345415 RepID=UPI003A8BECC4